MWFLLFKHREISQVLYTLYIKDESHGSVSFVLWSALTEPVQRVKCH